MAIPIIMRVSFVSYDATMEERRTMLTHILLL